MLVILRKVTRNGFPYRIRHLGCDAFKELHEVGDFLGLLRGRLTFLRGWRRTPVVTLIQQFEAFTHHLIGGRVATAADLFCDQALGFRTARKASWCTAVASSLK